MEYTEWLETITSDSQNEVAEKIGIARRTLQNQLYGTPKMETIVKISEAYGINPHQALTGLGYINAHWLRALATDVEATLIAATEQQLSDEVLRRMVRGLETDVLDTPVDELIEERGGTVHRLPQATHDGTVTDWDDSQPYAADGSDEEGGSPDDYIP